MPTRTDAFRSSTWGRSEASERRSRYRIAMSAPLGDVEREVSCDTRYPCHGSALERTAKPVAAAATMPPQPCRDRTGWLPDVTPIGVRRLRDSETSGGLG